MKRMGKVRGTLPGEVTLKAAKSKEVMILILRREGVGGDKAEDSR